LYPDELAIFPPRLMTNAFVAPNGEAAWPSSDVAAVIRVLKDHSCAILGGELWCVSDDDGRVHGWIPQRQGPSVVYCWDTARREGEEWTAYVARCAGNSARMVRRWEKSPLVPDGVQGRMVFNLTWQTNASL